MRLHRYIFPGCNRSTVTNAACSPVRDDGNICTAAYRSTGSNSCAARHRQMVGVIGRPDLYTLSCVSIRLIIASCCIDFGIIVNFRFCCMLDLVDANSPFKGLAILLGCSCRTRADRTHAVLRYRGHAEPVDFSGISRSHIFLAGDITREVLTGPGMQSFFRSIGIIAVLGSSLLALQGLRRLSLIGVRIAVGLIFCANCTIIRRKAAVMGTCLCIGIDFCAFANFGLHRLMDHTYSSSAASSCTAPLTANTTLASRRCVHGCPRSARLIRTVRALGKSCTASYQCIDTVIRRTYGRAILGNSLGTFANSRPGRRIHYIPINGTSRSYAAAGSTSRSHRGHPFLAVCLDINIIGCCH